MRMVWVLALIAALACGGLRAEVHVRGDYRFSTGPVPAFVERSRVADAWPADAPGADDSRWRYWLYDRQVDRRGGGELDFMDHVYEARTASLLGEAGRFEIEFLPDSQTLTLHEIAVRRAGVWTSRLDPARISLARREEGFGGDIADGVVTALLLLEDVRVGDVVRIAYSVDGGNPMLVGQRTDWLRGGFSNPTLAYRTRVLFDPGTRVDTRRWQTSRDARVRTSAEALEVALEGGAVAATVDHGDYPRGHTPREAIHVGRRQTWADVAAWALPFYPAVREPLPADLEQRVAAWRALPDPRARFAAALRAVQDDVRYFGIEIGENTHRPHAPAEVWRRRFGDCKDKAYLLVTLLERLGIAAVPALVSVDSGGRIADLVPSGDAFDHVIVRATLDGAAVWADPTATQQGGDPALADYSDLGVALPLAAETRGLEPIARPAGDPSGVEVRERFVVGRDATSAEMSIVTVYRGSQADDARRRLGSERIDDMARRYEDYYRKRYRELVALAPPKVEDDRQAGVFTVTEKYRLPVALEREGAVSMLDVYADGLQGGSTPPESQAHPGPLRMRELGRFVHEVEVEVPADWSARFVSERSTRRSPAFEFKRTLEVEGSISRLRYEMQATRRDLEARDVPAHLAELNAVREDMSARLRFQRPASVDARERETRLKALLREAIKETKE